MTVPIILASSSPYRQALLAKLGLKFETVAADVNETPLLGESATDLVLRLSQLKARTVARQYPNSIIIGSDQCGVLADQLLGKAGNQARAIQQLQACSGRHVIFHTGLAIYQPAKKQCWRYCETFEVKFRPLTKDDIVSYLNKEQPYDCAGSFKCEGLGIALFESMRGRDPNSLIGLPLIALVDGLRHFAINPLTI